MSTEVFVALGSNLGKKLDNLSHAIKLIPIILTIKEIAQATNQSLSMEFYEH